MLQKPNFPQDIIRTVEDVSILGAQVLEKIPDKNYELTTFTFINFLERFTGYTKSISLLLKNYSNNTETSIGLVLRTSLLDFFTIAYLSTYHPQIDTNENLTNFQKKIGELNSDHIHNTFKYLKLSLKNRIISKQEFNSAIDSTWDNFSFLFQNSDIDYEFPERKLIYKKFKSPTELFTRINSHKSLKAVSNVYDIYTYYSKYEHYGIMTHHMQRYDLKQDIERINLSLKYLIFGLTLSVTFINESLQSFNSEINELETLQKQLNKILND